MNTHAVDGLQISDLSCENEIYQEYTKDNISVSHSHIPTSQDIYQWNHLPEIDAVIGLLV